MSNIFVVGGANIDIAGCTIEPLSIRDSNPGKITISFGGVGRNIAENLSLLGENVYFCSVFSTDSFGEIIKEDLIAKGINLKYSKESVDNTSMYLAILDENKDMYLGMSDMNILNSLDIDTINTLINDLNEDDILVIDTNLNENIVEYICKNARCLIVMDPISTSKSHKVKNILNHIGVFKPNKYEAESISGIKINDKLSANENIDYFLSHGVKEIIISMSTDGVIVGNDKERYWLHHKNVEIVNATGGGDAFLAAYIRSRIKNKDIISNTKYAIGAAVSTIKSIDTVNQFICDSIIEKEIENLNINEENLCI